MNKLELTANEMINLVSLIDKVLFVMFYYDLNNKLKWVDNCENEFENIFKITKVRYEKIDNALLIEFMIDHKAVFIITFSEHIFKGNKNKSVSYIVKFKEFILSDLEIFEKGSRRANILNWFCMNLFGNELTSYQYKNILRKGRERLRGISI